MKVTVTGTSGALTSAQFNRLSRLLTEGVDELHHGMCIGADEASHRIAHLLGIRIIGYPGIDRDGKSPKRAKFDLNEFAEIMPECWYLDRNKLMVLVAPAVIGVVKKPGWYRSGEWQTINYAMRAGRPVKIILPDGSVEQLTHDKEKT